MMHAMVYMWDSMFFFSHEFMFSASFVDRLSTLTWGMYNWKDEFCG